jgi:hypothetical protein
MATGLEMFDALKRRIAALSIGSRFQVNGFDAKDLMKLTENDLMDRGFDRAIAERVDHDLLKGSLAELGKAIGIDLSIDRQAPNLIPGEGLKRAGGYLANDPQTLESLFEQLDRIRHPERHPA